MELAALQDAAVLDENTLPEDRTAGFIPLPNAPTLVANEEVNLVRVEVPRSAMMAVGLTVSEERALERVQADVMLGTAGCPARCVFWMNSISRWVKRSEIEMIRTTWIGILAAAASLYAQPGPPPGRGPGGIGGARFLGAEPGMPGRVVKNAPYSAEMVTETTQTLPDGNRIRQTNSSHYYRDSDGRTRREQSLGSLTGWLPIPTCREPSSLTTLWRIRITR